MNVETCYLPVIRVLKAGLGFMSFIPDSFQALGVRVRLQARVIVSWGWTERAGWELPDFRSYRHLL